MHYYREKWDLDSAIVYIKGESAFQVSQCPLIRGSFPVRQHYTAQRPARSAEKKLLISFCLVSVGAFHTSDCSAADNMHLQRAPETAGKTIVCQLPSLDDIAASRRSTD